MVVKVTNSQHILQALSVTASIEAKCYCFQEKLQNIFRLG